MPRDSVVGRSVMTPVPVKRLLPKGRSIWSPSRKTSPAWPAFSPVRLTMLSKTMFAAPVMMRSPPPVSVTRPLKVTSPVALMTRSPLTVTSFQNVTLEGKSPSVFAVTVSPSSASTPPTMPYTATMPGERRISVSAVASPFPSNR